MKIMEAIKLLDELNEKEEDLTDEEEKQWDEAKKTLKEGIDVMNYSDVEECVPEMDFWKEAIRGLENSIRHHDHLRGKVVEEY